MLDRLKMLTTVLKGQKPPVPCGIGARRSAQMNSIDKLISLANVRGSLDLRCQFQGDWARDHPQDVLGKAPYHIVLKGECRVEFLDGQRLPMRAGDILLLPRGAPHTLHSIGKTVEPGTPRLVPGGTLPLYRIGGVSTDLDMLCGSFHYNRTSTLFTALPEHLVIPSAALAASASLRALVEILRAEADSDQVGAHGRNERAHFALALRRDVDAERGDDACDHE